MYAIAPLASAILFVLFLIFKPLFNYYYDRKGLRAYPNYSWFCSVYSIGWCIVTWRGGVRSKELVKMHQVHPVVRIGPNSLSYRGDSAIKDIYGHRTDCPKDVFYIKQAGSHFNMGDVIDKRHHSRKRKTVSSAFALKNLEGWEFKVTDKVSSFIKACDRHCTSPLADVHQKPDHNDLTFDYREWTNLFTIDAIADIALSERLELLQAGNDLVTAESLDGKLSKAHFREGLHATKAAQTRIVYADKWYDFNSKYTTRLLPSYRKLWRLSQGWSGIVYHRATKRLARYRAGEKLNDFFQALMEDSAGNPNGLEWGEIVVEVSLMLDAGSDTTAIAMSNVIYWLLRNPECLARLREEVDQVFDPDEIVASYDKVKHLPYLRACLDENLRITPSLSMNLPRRTPAEGCIIQDKFVPGGTSVSVSPYVAHRNENIFPEPEKYRPERWLGEKGKSLQSHFFAFSTGSRGCIGRNISYLEQTILLASVVHRYNFALPEPNWEQNYEEVTNMLPGPMFLKVWRRDADSSESM